MGERNIFAELKRRNVYKVAVAYGVVGWLVVQVVSTVLPMFYAPEWVAQTSSFSSYSGFPLCRDCLGIRDDSEGMKRTKACPRPTKLPQWSKRKFIAVFATLALIAAALLGLAAARASECAGRATHLNRQSKPDGPLQPLTFRKEHRRPALRKPEQRQGERLFRRWHPG